MNKLILQLKFKNNGKSKDYKIETIYNNIIFVKEIEYHLLGPYYLISWNGYQEKKCIWGFVSAIKCLQKLIITFHTTYFEIQITTSFPIDLALLIARTTIKPTIKNKAGQSKLQVLISTIKKVQLLVFSFGTSIRSRSFYFF